MCCKPAMMAMMSELGNSFRNLDMSVVLAVARKVDALREVQQKTKHGVTLYFNEHMTTFLLYLIHWIFRTLPP